MPLQVQSLLIKPWHAVIESNKLGQVIPIIVIDALDECENISTIMDALLHDLQALKFFANWARPKPILHRLVSFYQLEFPLWSYLSSLITRR